MRLLRWLLVTMLWCFSALAMADISEATFTPQGSQTYPATSAAMVEVYVYRPDFKFVVIGVIDAHGMAGGAMSLLDSLQLKNLFGAPPGEKEDMALAIQALKDEASRAGADGVIIVNSQQVPVGPNATERRIRAAAIKKID